MWFLATMRPEIRLSWLPLHAVFIFHKQLAAPAAYAAGSVVWESCVPKPDWSGDREELSEFYHFDTFFFE